MLIRREKRWKDCEQPGFRLGLIPNPSEKLFCFGPNETQRSELAPPKKKPAKQLPAQKSVTLEALFGRATRPRSRKRSCRRGMLAQPEENAKDEEGDNGRQEVIQRGVGPGRKKNTKDNHTTRNYMGVAHLGKLGALVTQAPRTNKKARTRENPRTKRRQKPEEKELSRRKKEQGANDREEIHTHQCAKAQEAHKRAEETGSAVVQMAQHAVGVFLAIFNPLSRRREPDTRRPVWTRHRTSAAQDYIDAGSILRGSSEKAAFPQSLPCAMRKKSALSGQPYERPGFNALRFASISLFFLTRGEHHA
ncbi:hypothetical protein C8J57DRAFT_1232377 [Mycena rebaudengoi]|nr:hypothetical protein C8J57DRAFT_1232377 [Mycena rebaudengoi]